MTLLLRRNCYAAPAMTFWLLAMTGLQDDLATATKLPRCARNDILVAGDSVPGWQGSATHLGMDMGYNGL